MTRFEVGQKVRVKETGETGTVKRVDTDRHGNVQSYVVVHECDISSDRRGGWSYSPEKLEVSEIGHSLTRSGGINTINTGANW